MTPADQALKLKLIDSIGYWDEAFDETCDLLGVKDLHVVTYESETSFFDKFLGVRSPLPTLKSLLSAAGTPRRLYLWRQ